MALCTQREKKRAPTATDGEKSGNRKAAVQSWSYVETFPPKIHPTRILPVVSPALVHFFSFSPPFPYFPFSLLPRFMARGEKIFERQFWGIFEKSKSRNFSKNRRKEGSPRNFLAFLDLFATSLRCGYYFRRKGRDGK